MSSKKNRTWEQQMRVDQQNNYDETNTEQIKLKLNRKTDADVLGWLRRQQWKPGKSMQGEIKRLIREEIAREAAESCRCTPTPTETGIKASDPVRKSDFETEKYLCATDVREYLQRYPDATDEELLELAQWIKNGNSFLDNGYYIADESGCPMDFIQGERAMADMIEALANNA